MGAKLFSSQNRNSSAERDSLNSMQIALDPVQYAENIAWLLQYQVNGNLFRYIISRISGTKVNGDFF